MTFVGINLGCIDHNNFVTAGWGGSGSRQRRRRPAWSSSQQPPLPSATSQQLKRSHGSAKGECPHPPHTLPTCPSVTAAVGRVVGAATHEARGVTMRAGLQGIRTLLASRRRGELAEVGARLGLVPSDGVFLPRSGAAGRRLHGERSFLPFPDPPLNPLPFRSVLRRVVVP